MKAGENFCWTQSQAGARCVCLEIFLHTFLNEFNIVKAFCYQKRCAAMSSDRAKDENWIRASRSPLLTHMPEKHEKMFQLTLSYVVWWCAWSGVQKHISADRFSSINYSCSAAGRRNENRYFGPEDAHKKSILFSNPSPLLLVNSATESLPKHCVKEKRKSIKVPCVTLKEHKVCA